MAKLTAQEKEWQAQSDLTTLVSADKIQADAKRFAAAKAESKRQQAALKKVAKPITKPIAKKIIKRKGQKR